MNTILKFPRIYNLFSRIVGIKVFSVYVDKYIRPKKGNKILDIGCGTAEILYYLPKVEYVGLDMNQAYIDYAKKRFGNRGKFLNQRVREGIVNELSLFDFDRVLAKGVLHHLNDDEAIQLFELARSALKHGGRLITFDGCYVKGQPWLARLILSKDRGKYVRTKDEYLSLASNLFKDIQVSIHHDLIRIPYTHIIMECTA
jgi:SAM-dependent methyltransferase